MSTYILWLNIVVFMFLVCCVLGIPFRCCELSGHLPGFCSQRPWGTDIAWLPLLEQKIQLIFPRWLPSESSLSVRFNKQSIYSLAMLRCEATLHSYLSFFVRSIGVWLKFWWCEFLSISVGQCSIQNWHVSSAVQDLHYIYSNSWKLGSSC
jgi:hypothetical protein